MIKRIFTALVLTGFVFVMYSCGNENSAPVDSTIAISPASFEVSDGTSLDWHTTYFLITVKNKLGQPLNDVKLTISFVWATPDSEGLIQLYDNYTPVDSPMTVTTDEDGSYTLRVDFQSGGGLEYSADLLVYSGSDSATAEISVDAGE